MIYRRLGMVEKIEMSTEECKFVLKNKKPVHIGLAGSFKVEKKKVLLFKERTVCRMINVFKVNLGPGKGNSVFYYFELWSYGISLWWECQTLLEVRCLLSCIHHRSMDYLLSLYEEE